MTLMATFAYKFYRLCVRRCKTIEAPTSPALCLFTSSDKSNIASFEKSVYLNYLVK